MAPSSICETNAFEIQTLDIPTLVCYTAVLSVVTKCSSTLRGALRDDTKNGCVADYTYLL